MSGCNGGPIQVKEDQIIGEIEENRLTVFNSSDQDIYYAIFDQSILPFILWAPISSEENKIPGFRRKTFEISEILRGDNTSGTLVFYFWVEKDSENARVKSINFEVSD